MISILILVISLIVISIISLFIGIYIGFIIDKKDHGKIRRFYNERKDGEEEISRLKKRIKELEEKLKTRQK